MVCDGKSEVASLLSALAASLHLFAARRYGPGSRRF